MSQRESLEEHLMALAFLSERWPFLRQKKVVSLIKTTRLVRILEVLGSYLKKYKTLKSERLAKMLPPELVEIYNGFYLLDLAVLLKDDDRLEGELERTLLRLESLDLREKLIEISRQISLLEKKHKKTSAEKKQLESLTSKFRNLSLKLFKKTKEQEN
jgi:hypothetical protein